MGSYFISLFIFKVFAKSCFFFSGILLVRLAAILPARTTARATAHVTSVQKKINSSRRKQLRVRVGEDGTRRRRNREPSARTAARPHRTQ